MTNRIAGRSRTPEFPLILREPEDLKKAIGCPLEQIGQQLATECRDAYENFWAHELLAHNQSEITRLRDAIHPILFPIATGP